MSAFLGPIHIWLYNKILIQQSIVNKIVEAGKEIVPKLGEYLDTKYGVSQTEPLEEVIDVSNIHGWLQEQIAKEEYKLAESVTQLQKENPAFLNEIKIIFWNNGGEVAKTAAMENAMDIYKTMNDSLLDGMPCDHTNNVVEQGEEKIIWKRNSCIHQKYWDEVNGDISLYDMFREEWIKGFLANTEYSYEKIGDDTFAIRRNIK